MKTTVDLPDDLYRRAKIEAASRDRTLKDSVKEGLELVLGTPRGARARPDLALLMRDARGVVDSGIPGFASNPAHLAGFGGGTRRDR